MGEHKRVWIDNFGNQWDRPPRGQSRENFGPFTEMILAPADAIVIERSKLPEVEADGDTLTVCGQKYVPGSAAADVVQRIVLRWLAVREYLDANPPVDEAEVSALATDLRDILGITPETVAAGHQRPGNSEDTARALIARGWKRADS